MSDKEIIVLGLTALLLISMICFWAYQEYLDHKEKMEKLRVKFKELEKEIERGSRERRIRGEDR